MTTRPPEPGDPSVQPEEVPDGQPSRPHGDPVMPDPDDNAGGARP